MSPNARSVSPAASRAWYASISAADTVIGTRIVKQLVALPGVVVRAITTSSRSTPCVSVTARCDACVNRIVFGITNETGSNGLAAPSTVSNSASPSVAANSRARIANVGANSRRSPST